MKKTLIALLLANLALVGCGSDDDNNKTVAPDPDPDPQPVETVTIDEATSINVVEPALAADTGSVTFSLATDEEVAITGLDTAEVVFVGLLEPKTWTHMSDTMGLPAHELQKFGADDISITEDEATPGSYTMTPADFDWDGAPTEVKAKVVIGELAPIVLEATP